MARIRELISDTMIYGISSVVARFINYLLVPFYTKFFAPGEYGIIGLIYAAIIFLNVIFTFGMESAYLRYAAERERSKRVFVTLQLFLLISASLLVLIFWWMNPLISPLMSLDSGGEHLFLMMLSILWLDALGIVPFAELRLIRKAWIYAFIRLGNVIINVGLNLYLVIVLGMGLEAILISNIIASGFSLIALLIFTGNMLTAKPDMALMMRALRFGIPYIPAGLAYAINEVVDRFFLNQMTQEDITRIYGAEYTAEEITGIYNACYKIAIFMMLIVQMFRMAWQPFFMRHAKSDQLKPTLTRVFTLFNFGAATVFMFVSIFVAEIVSVRVPVLDATIIDSRYWMGLHIIPFLLMAYWFQGWYANFMPGIFIKEQTKKLPLITLLGSILTISLNYILVPKIGMMGSAIATLSCYFGMSLLLLYHSRKAMHVDYQFMKIIIIMVLSILAVFLSNELPFVIVSELMTKLLIFLSTFLIIGGFIFRYEIQRLLGINSTHNQT